MAVRLRVAQALRLWHDVTLAQARAAEPDLSTRQMSVLIAVYLEPQPHTVRGLAERLGVTKPVITRALDTMGRLGLVARKRDPSDRRSVLVQRTVGGALYLQRLGDLIAERAAALPA
jgi:DNA-binding MarR family transcriptional regulator